LLCARRRHRARRERNGDRRPRARCVGAHLWLAVHPGGSVPRLGSDREAAAAAGFITSAGAGPCPAGGPRPPHPHPLLASSRAPERLFNLTSQQRALNRCHPRGSVGEARAFPTGPHARPWGIASFRWRRPRSRSAIAPSTARIPCVCASIPALGPSVAWHDCCGARRAAVALARRASAHGLTALSCSRAPDGSLSHLVGSYVVGSVAPSGRASETRARPQAGRTSDAPPAPLAEQATAAASSAPGGEPLGRGPQAGVALRPPGNGAYPGGSEPRLGFVARLQRGLASSPHASVQAPALALPLIPAHPHPQLPTLERSFTPQKVSMVAFCSF
jgi:hypothetical protein